MKRFFWAGGVAAAVLVAVAALMLWRQGSGEPHGPPAVLVEIARAFPDAVFFKQTSAPVVALTIDDVPAAGPDGDEATRVILAAIAAWNATTADADRRVAATFFVISDHLVDGSTILADIAAGGHEIGNHGEADATAATLSRADFVRQLQASHDRLVRFTDQPIRWYRPGRGLFTPAMTEALRAFPGYEPRFALASMLPVDTFQPADDPGFTAWYVGRHVFPGAILVLHGGTLAQSRQTAAALRLILPELARRGYRVVTLSRLWGLS